MNNQAVIRIDGRAVPDDLWADEHAGDSDGKTVGNIRGGFQVAPYGALLAFPQDAEADIAKVAAECVNQLRFVDDPAGPSIRGDNLIAGLEREPFRRQVRPADDDRLAVHGRDQKCHRQVRR